MAARVVTSSLKAVQTYSEDDRFENTNFHRVVIIPGSQSLPKELFALTDLL